MLDVGSKLVFLIQPCEKINQNREIWSKNVRHSVLKTLHRFEGSSLFRLRSSAQNSDNCQLKWAYKFMNSGGQKLCRNKQDLKDFTASEFSFFEDEVRYVADENRENHKENTVPTGGAHILYEELMSIVHDYDWENSSIISPVKLKRKNGSFNRRSDKHGNRNRNSNSMSKILQNGMKDFAQNIVVLISPMPHTQEELNSYFEWHVNDVEYVSNKLMPSHLKSYFREKHNISLLWIDIRINFSDLCETSNDQAGIEIMKNFLNSIGGCSIPIERLCSNFDTERENAIQQALTTSSWNMTCLKGLIPMTNWLYQTQLSSSGDTKSTANDIHTVHVCRKVFSDGCFQIQKICMLTTSELDIGKEAIDTMLSQVVCRNCRPYETSDTVSCTISSLPGYDEASSNLSVNFSEKIVQKCENLQAPKPETVFMVSGTMQQNHIAYLLKSDFLPEFYFTWCDIAPSIEGSCISLSETLVVQTHKYCTICGTEPSTDHCGVARYALLQILTSKLAFIVFLSSLSSKIISKLMNSDLPGWTDQPMLPQENQNKNLQSVELTNQANTNLTNLFIRTPKSFHSAMLERWSSTVETNTFDDLIPDDAPESSDPVHDDILQKLQDLYMSKPEPSNQRKDDEKNTKKCEPQTKTTEFESEESMIEMLKIEYNKSLESEIDVKIGDVPVHYCGEIVNIAQTIASVVFHHAQNMEESNWKNFGESLITQHFLCSATDIRKKNMDATNGKLQESILQILLRLECVSRLQPPQDETFEEIVEDICSLLRLISLSVSPEMMLRCLSHVFVGNYSSTCGELLCEVHNELMQPLPLQLKQFSKEASEESADITGIKSVLDSVMSNTSSACSFGGPESNNSMTRRPMRRISSFSQLGRQIEVPGLVKQKSSASLNDERTSTDNIKTRLRSSTKKEKPINTNLKKIGQVKRDLFSVGDSENKSVCNIDTKSNCTNHKKSSRRMSVSDTPDAKQGMTALSRQRMRLHREQRNKTEKEMVTIIEESPMKVEDEPVRPTTEIKSPRHKVMLARRHSFYCGGRESRNVARAKIIHQHQQAAPSTPVPDGKKKKRAELSDGISPNSLLFVHNSQKNFVSPARSKPLFSLCDDSPAKNTRSHATKALFQSPAKKSGTKTLFQSPAKQHVTNLAMRLLSPDPKSPISVNKTPVKNVGEVFIKGIQPILQSPMKIEQDLNSDVLEGPSMLSPMKTPSKRQLTLRGRTPKSTNKTGNSTAKLKVCSDILQETPPETDNKGLATSDTSIYPDLLAVAGEEVDSELQQATQVPKSQATLDDYVIRTPRDKKRVASVTDKPQNSRKRRWSVDTTPTRDDINKWPRKKRGTDKSSPGIVSKKIKRSAGDLCKSKDKPAKLFDDSSQDFSHDNYVNDVFSSPDNGLIVLDNGQSTSTGTAKSYSAVKAPPLLHGMLFRNTDTNENIVSPNDLIALPPTPKLRLGISRHQTNRKMPFSTSKKQSADDIWNEVFPFDEQNENVPDVKLISNAGNDSSKLSAKSLLHIQNSPILTPKQKKAARTKIDFAT